MVLSLAMRGVGQFRDGGVGPLVFILGTYSGLKLLARSLAHIHFERLA